MDFARVRFDHCTEMDRMLTNLPIDAGKLRPHKPVGRAPVTFSDSGALVEIKTLYDCWGTKDGRNTQVRAMAR
jgi:hypothetical protein